jgi:hypothetical protein
VINAVIVMGNKRGQFYLIAAIVIIAVLFGIVGLTNYASTRPPQTQTYELSKELNLESESVVNYGIFNGGDVDSILTNFSEVYGQYVGQNSNIYFIYGDQQQIKVITYTSGPSGTIGLDLGGSQTTLIIQGNQVSRNTIDVNGNHEVIVKIGDKSYPFELKEGQNFFFVIQEPVLNA